MPELIAPIQSELGKKSEYDAHYNPEKLFPILRQINRDKIGIHTQLPFKGFDIWNHYEVSWLNEKGKPMVGLAEIIVPCGSPFLIESKSMKLYFNSFNNTHVKDIATLEATIKKDLEKRLGAPIFLKILLTKDFKNEKLFNGFEGTCVDDLDIACDIYLLTQSLLKTENEIVTETIYTDLFKANCLVTNQPDWGSIQVSYSGNKINHAAFLKYIVSYRNGNEFSETTIERVFVDIMQYCKPKTLTVYGRFTRRGGLDINPLRSTEIVSYENLNARFCRQ